MKLKLILPLAVLSAVAMSSAQATSYFEGEAFMATGPNDTFALAQDLGMVGPGTLTDLFGSRLMALPGTDTADYYKITVTVPTMLMLAVNTPGGPSYANDPMLGLFDAAFAPLAFDDDGGPGFDSYIAMPVMAGVHYVAVSGWPDYSFAGGGSADWVYSLEISAPIPEPGTYALMLAGLGVIGFVARRRSA